MKFVTIFLIAASAFAQSDGVACFEKLTPPEYPAAALEARVEGSIWTTITIDADGVASKIETKALSVSADAQKLLAPAVEKAIRSATVKPECAGKTVNIAFRFLSADETTQLRPNEAAWVIPVENPSHDAEKRKQK